MFNVTYETGHTAPCCFKGNVPSCVAPCQPPESASRPVDSALARQLESRFVPIAGEINKVLAREYLRLVVESQFKCRGQKNADTAQKFLQPNLARPKDHEIIHEPHIVAYTELIFDVVVELVQIDVCENLTCQTALGDTLAMGKAFALRDLLPNQPEDILIADSVPNEPHQNLVVYVVKILRHIAFQNIELAVQRLCRIQHV